MLTSCSSSSPSAAQQTASPRSACSLLTAGEANTAFGGHVLVPNQCATLPSNQSDVLYIVSGPEPGTVQVNVAWGKKQVTTFTVTHGM